MKLSAPIHKYDGIRLPMHPGSLRCLARQELRLLAASLALRAGRLDNLAASPYLPTGARSKLVLFLFIAFFLSGCATMQTDFEAPTVNVIQIRPLVSDEMAPKFEIGLHIINPNRTSLKLHGIAYTLSLEGYDLLTGVANELPEIQGYGEGDVKLVATTNMLNSVRFLSELMYGNKDSIAFSLNVKLDFGGLVPVIRVQEKGKIDLSDHIQ